MSFFVNVALYTTLCQQAGLLHQCGPGSYPTQAALLADPHRECSAWTPWWA